MSCNRSHFTIQNKHFNTVELNCTFKGVIKAIKTGLDFSIFSTRAISPFFSFSSIRPSFPILITVHPFSFLQLSFCWSAFKPHLLYMNCRINRTNRVQNNITEFHMTFYLDNQIILFSIFVIHLNHSFFQYLLYIYSTYVNFITVKYWLDF